MLFCLSLTSHNATFDREHKRRSTAGAGPTNRCSRRRRILISRYLYRTVTIYHTNGPSRLKQVESSMEHLLSIRTVPERGRTRGSLARSAAKCGSTPSLDNRSPPRSADWLHQLLATQGKSVSLVSRSVRSFGTELVSNSAT